MKEEIWLNAMKCVHPTDEFALALGHDIIKALKLTATRSREPLEPIFKLDVQIVAS